jgi:hypothetical protein
VRYLAVCLIAPVLLILGCGDDSREYAGGDANDTGPRIGATCYRSHASEDDPMFKPTTKPPAHAHDFYGNQETDQDSTTQTLIGGPTTCKQERDSSAWWHPAITQSGETLRPSRMVIYYEVNRELPKEKIMDVDRQPTFKCGDNISRSLPERCGSGFQIRLEFDQCYDPTRPTEIEANTAPIRNGRCPETHPNQLAMIQAQVNVPLRDPDLSTLRTESNSGVNRPMSEFHINFMNGWDQARLAELVDDCLRDTGFDDPRPEKCRVGNA